MNTKLLLTWATLALLFTACEDKIESYTAPYDGPYTVTIPVGLPGVYGQAILAGELFLPLSDVAVKVYESEQDYVLDENVLIEGYTNGQGEFEFEHTPSDTLWFRAQKDTLNDLRGIRQSSREVPLNQITIGNEPGSGNYDNVEVVLTNTPTKLRLSVFHEGQAVEGAQVQLYFTEQAYQDSLAAQQDFEQLRPTYGYQSDDPDLFDPEGSFVYFVEDYFLQTTDESGEVYFDNLEPRNYWFRITKDTLSNEGTVIRTREALPRNADITTQQEVISNSRRRTSKSMKKQLLIAIFSIWVVSSLYGQSDTHVTVTANLLEVYSNVHDGTHKRHRWRFWAAVGDESYGRSTVVT